MKILDNFNENKKKIEESKNNVKNNLTQENRNNVRYLFAALFGLAALLALSVSFYKLFWIYFLVGISLCPILYHNIFTRNVSIRIIHILEFSIPIFILIILIII